MHLVENKIKNKTSEESMSKEAKRSNGKLKRELGLGAATAIVIGNMIESGIFTSPQLLAEVGNALTTILAWIITGFGSVLLARCSARSGYIFPDPAGTLVSIEKVF